MMLDNSEHHLKSIGTIDDSRNDQLGQDGQASVAQNPQNSVPRQKLHKLTEELHAQLLLYLQGHILLQQSRMDPKNQKLRAAESADG